MCYEIHSFAIKKDFENDFFSQQFASDAIRALCFILNFPISYHLLVI